MPRQRRGVPWLGRERLGAGWYIYWYDPAARRVRRCSTGVDDRQRAEEALGLFIIERARSGKPDKLQPPERYPVSTALRWYAQERAPALASAVQAGYAIDHLIKFFGAAHVSSLTPESLKRYERERGVARGTVRRELAVLSAAIGHAIKNGRLTGAPTSATPPPSSTGSRRNGMRRTLMPSK